MTQKVWTKAEILELIQPNSADTKTKQLFRELSAVEQLHKIEQFANLYELKVA